MGPAPDHVAEALGLDGNAHVTWIERLRFADGETDYPGGGTSLSSPLWMGMWTRIQAAAPKVGDSYPGVGFANPTLYAQFNSSHAGALP